MSLPIIAITMGDPAGVGPELALQLLRESPSDLGCIPIVFGDLQVLQKVSMQLGIMTDFTAIELHEWKNRTSSKLPSVVNLNSIGIDEFTPGKINAASGKASYNYVTTAIDECLAGRIDGITTCPINKEALHLAGVPFPGHTELLASQTKTERYCMMLTAEQITCSLVTTHIGLNEVSKALQQDRIEQVIQLSYDAIKQLRVREPRLAVCGLNPHSGEHGLFGDGEEERIILPAIETFRKRKMDIVGPLPADTAFTPAMRENIDCYICMYHDQGLIPLKALAFDTAVNVTLGLPIIRTSVDHGTALDIAWKGQADRSNLIHATQLAALLADQKKRYG